MGWGMFPTLSLRKGAIPSIRDPKCHICDNRIASSQEGEGTNWIVLQGVG